MQPQANSQITLRPQELPERLKGFFASCPFACLINDALLLENIGSGNWDAAIVALVLAWSMYYSGAPSEQEESAKLLAFAHDRLLSRSWNDGAADLYHLAIGLCLLARWFDLEQQARRKTVLYHLTGMAARRYLELHKPANVGAASQIELIMVDTCSCIIWLVASVNLLPAISLDTECESLIECRPT